MYIAVKFEGIISLLPNFSKLDKQPIGNIFKNMMLRMHALSTDENACAI